MHQRIASIGLGLTLALGGSAQAAGQLNVVSWSGYFAAVAGEIREGKRHPRHGGLL